MQDTLVIGTPQTVTGTAADVTGKPNGATLSATTFTSSDPTVFTVVPDPNTPSVAVITGVALGNATLTEIGTASDNNAVVQGVATITVVNPAPPPTTQIIFSFK